MLYESPYYGVVRMDDVIQHHGIKGQKWGVRRFQNDDGSLTDAGKRRYMTRDEKIIDKYQRKETKKLEKQYEKGAKKILRGRDAIEAAYEKELQKKNPSSRLLKQYEDAHAAASSSYRLNRNAKQLETDSVMKATVSDVRDERRGVKHDRNKITTAYLIETGGNIPLAVALSHLKASDSTLKMNYRLSLGESAKAADRSAKEGKKESTERLSELRKKYKK